VNDQNPCIGIDLGTTHSVVAVLEAAGPRVLRNELGHTLVPSVVAIDATGRLVVGAPARERLTSAPRSAASRFKTDMGEQRTHQLGELSLSPISLSSLVLREMRTIAETALDLPITEAVITVPAWFREPQRRATIDAATLAGLGVRRLVNEPTAAALAHGLGRGSEAQTIAVLDLGGGTFDVTILELFEGVVEVRASVGDVHLGGEDFTDALLRHALRKAGRVSALDDLTHAKLRARAEQGKRALSVRPTAELDLTEAGGRLFTIDRTAFASCTADLLQRMQRCAREALVQAGLRPAAVHELLLVGGATRMPAVHELATTLFQRLPRADTDVDHLVARGAAVQAGLARRHAAVRELMVTDVLTHSLGVRVRAEWGEHVFEDHFDPVLSRGTTLPATRRSTYQTLSPLQDSILLRIYEGEHRQASANTPLGELHVMDLPTHPDAPDARERLEVCFTHDTSGLLEVEATVQSTGTQARLVLARGGTLLDPQARATAELELRRLRTHPRDLLPNRWLLERAARLVTLVPGAVRREVDLALMAFEAALAHGDPGLILQRRDGLTALVEALHRRYLLDLDGDL
jgi:molecular chaperone HscC